MVQGSGRDAKEGCREEVIQSGAVRVGAPAPSCFEAEALVKENWWGFRSADFNSNSLSKSVSLGPFPSG